MIIKRVFARKIKDSRGKYTIEVSVNGSSASSPSGKSTGGFESKPYMKNIDWNISFLNSWNSEVEINNFDDLKILEKEICKKAKIKNVKNFGANALFALESAALKALAREKKKELWEIINPGAKDFPRPVANVVGGGLHSEQFAEHPEFQEFMIIPNSKSFKRNVKIVKYCYLKLKKYGRGINDEGAWNIPGSNEKIFDLIHEIVLKAERKFGCQINVGTDVAANSFYKKDYVYLSGKKSRENQIRYINHLIANHNLFYVEDPLIESDFKGFSKLVKAGLIVGDDLTATQLDRVKRAVKNRSINAMIVKPNQNGSLLEVKEIVDYCKKHGIKTIMSHRSGETMDASLSDYAFGFQTDFIKCGAATKWRDVKLKRMIGIEKHN